jgi:hypothetical protein
MKVIIGLSKNTTKLEMEEKTYIAFCIKMLPAIKMIIKTILLKDRYKFSLNKENINKNNDNVM